ADSPGTINENAEITSMIQQNAQEDDVEVTHMQSPNRTKEYIPGLTDLSDMSMEINYIPGSVTDEFIIAWKDAGDTRSTRITYPNGIIDTFPSYPKSYQPTANPGDKMSASLTLKVAGAIVRT
ncbi:MAG: phage tail tube protein, partial [Hyphomonadaceae bacterium]|nr:phage tail tube protein [Hyphomonadaceae bacterium]